ncbi:hypothetical protein [Lysobacter sp. A378]
MKWLLVPCVACCAGLLWPALAYGAAAIGDEDLRVYLGALELGARLDVDLTGDGRAELVYVATDSNERVLGVIDGRGDPARLGAHLLGEAPLAATPQSPVSLSVDNGQLLVEQFAGEGTVSVSSYRYRYDAAVQKLRLIELAVEQYDDAARQGTLRISWDLDAGEQVVVHSEPATLDNGQQVYVYGPELRSIRLAAPIYLSGTPDPLALFEFEGRREMLVSSDRKH